MVSIIVCIIIILELRKFQKLDQFFICNDVLSYWVFFKTKKKLFRVFHLTPSATFFTLRFWTRGVTICKFNHISKNGLKFLSHCHPLTRSISAEYELNYCFFRELSWIQYFFWHKNFFDKIKAQILLVDFSGHN